MKTIRSFWGVGNNFGDTLTPVILEHFTDYRAKWVSSLDSDKLLLCGSILEFAKPGDTVLGAGHYKEEKIDLTGVRVIALRGKDSGIAPLYGDPGILLPFIYNPKTRTKRKVGYIPHLWERDMYNGHPNDLINVELPWKKFVSEILASEHIVTTSLHGAIIAEAYGVSVKWLESEIVPGARIKYEDYKSGISNGIKRSQLELMEALRNL